MADGLSSHGIPLAERGVSDQARGTSKAPHRIAAAATAPSAAAPKNAWQKGRARGKATKPIWEFTVAAWVTQETARQYRDLAAVRKLVEQQLLSVAFRFNSAEAFKGTFQFRLNDLQVFSGDSVKKALEPHPKSDFSVVYDAFPVNITDWGGGFYDPSRTIHHAWDADSDGGIFGDVATDGLVHEFGHARGAIDIYALEVRQENNPVVGTSYDPGPSIMNDQRGVRVWDQHSIHIIDANTNSTDAKVYDITPYFPGGGIDIFVVDSSVRMISGAAVALYPVRWEGNAVEPTATVTGSTDAHGKFRITGNPFTLDPQARFGLKYCNFLVVAKRGSSTGHDWLPVTYVQNYFFMNGSSSTAAIAITLP